MCFTGFVAGGPGAACRDLLMRGLFAARETVQAGQPPVTVAALDAAIDQLLTGPEVDVDAWLASLPVDAATRSTVDVAAGHVAVVEIKATDWDRIRPGNVRRNFQAHARQLQDYVDWLYHEQGHDVAASILYPKPPTDPDRRAGIETYFDALAITVVWASEAQPPP